MTKIPLCDTDGSIIGTCGISKDITKLKETEDALHAANATLAEQKTLLEQSMVELRLAREAAEFKVSIGDVPLMRELVRMFLEDWQTMPADARQALDDHDAEALHLAAHSLKGMVGIYCAAPAFHAVSVLTDNTRAGNLHHARKLLDVAIQEIARLTSALEHFQQDL